MKIAEFILKKHASRAVKAAKALPLL